MKLSILLFTKKESDGRAEDVIAHDLKPGETVEALGERLLGGRLVSDGADYGARIEIRAVKESDQEDSRPGGKGQDR